MDEFQAFVAQAWPRLLRSAWLLTGDWHRAEDLVQTVLGRAYGRWSRLADGNPEAYLRAMLATTYLSWWRRRWRGEVPVERLPEHPAGADAGEVTLGSRTGSLFAIGQTVGVRWQVRDLYCELKPIPNEGDDATLDNLRALIDEFTWP